MPTGLRKSGRPLPGQREVITAMRDRRLALDYSCQDVAEESGFYGRAMISLLENSLRRGFPPERRVRMSARGMESLRRWLSKTEKRTKRKAA